jgi:glycosyltransferase involved in cell wall biosynthesis
MKITIVLGAFLPVPAIMGGAVEKAWLMLAMEFAARGHSVTVISRAHARLPSAEMRAGVRHVRVKGFDTPRSLLWLKCLDLFYSVRARFALPRADVLVTNTFWLPVLVRDSKPGRIYVHVARFPKGQLSLYGNASRLQAPSAAVARAIREQVPSKAEKVTVIPYPAPSPLSKEPPPPLLQREKIILFVGRVHPEKGVHLLVQAFAAQARTLFAEWKLMIVGPVDEKFGGGGKAYMNSLKNSEGPATGQLDFTGPIFDPAELEKILRAARLFVYPSLAERGESFGLAPLEAMTHACAVLVSNLECFGDFIGDSVTGFVFNHRAQDPARVLADKMVDVLSNETILARVAAAGYEKATEYSLPRMADRFLEDFHSLSENY